MRKNQIAILLLSILTGVLVLASCNTQDADPTDSSKSGSFDSSPVDTTLLISTPGSVWYMIGNGVSECLNFSYKGSIIQLTPGNTHSNVMRLNAGDTQFALLHNNVASEGYAGTGVFETKHDQIRSVASFYPSVLQMVVLESVGARSLNDIIDNKIRVRLSIGNPGGATSEAFERMLALYGLTLEDMKGWGCTIYNKSQSDSSKMLSDGMIDGYLILTLAPSPSVVEASINKKLVFVEFDRDIIAKLSEEYGYNVRTVSAGTYEFMTDDSVSVSSVTILGASIDTPDEVVYKTVKSIHENMDYMKSIHVALKEMTLESMIEDLGIPMHPGAEMYYREMGLID
ncbi:MAG: TAXI family TRAP transporter solute-binding subunit [Eubacteriales bacterium]|nr:TAXI family TRAP transporter solute-binding subunit [Eubacteriales bacterium]